MKPNHEWNPITQSWDRTGTARTEREASEWMDKAVRVPAVDPFDLHAYRLTTKGVVDPRSPK